MVWVKAHDTLFTGKWQGVEMRHRFVLLHLALLARDLEGVIELPLGSKDLADGVANLIGGDRRLRRQVMAAVRYLESVGTIFGGESAPGGSLQCTIPTWKEYQSASTSTSRVRRYRAKLKQNQPDGPQGNALHDVTETFPKRVTETRGNAPRGEERRGETLSNESAPTAPTGSGAAPQTSLALGQAQTPTTPPVSKSRPKRRKAQPDRPGKEAGSETPKQTPRSQAVTALSGHFWGAWRSAYQEKYASPYVGTQADGAVVKRLATKSLELAQADSTHTSEAILEHWATSYLVDAGYEDHLAEQRHPLRCIERDLNKMGLPGERERRARAEAQRRARRARAENEEMERNKRDGMSLRNARGNIKELLAGMRTVKVG